MFFAFNNGIWVVFYYACILNTSTFFIFYNIENFSSILNDFIQTVTGSLFYRSCLYVFYIVISIWLFSNPRIQLS